jgi:hypothetical protein
MFSNGSLTTNVRIPIFTAESPSDEWSQNGESPYYKQVADDVHQWYLRESTSRMVCSGSRIGQNIFTWKGWFRVTKPSLLGSLVCWFMRVTWFVFFVRTCKFCKTTSLTYLKLAFFSRISLKISPKSATFAQFCITKNGTPEMMMGLHSCESQLIINSLPFGYFY